MLLLVEFSLALFLIIDDCCLAQYLLIDVFSIFIILHSVLMLNVSNEFKLVKAWE